MRRITIDKDNENILESSLVRKVVLIKDYDKKVHLENSDAVIFDTDIEACLNSIISVYGECKGRIYDHTSALAYGYSILDIYDNTYGKAFDFSVFNAYGCSMIKAYDFSVVNAYECSTIKAFGKSTVRAYGPCTIYAYGNTIVERYDKRARIILDDEATLTIDKSLYR